MVATAETILESKPQGKRRSTSIPSASSVVDFTDHGPMITDQQFGITDDLLPDTPIPRHRALGSCLDVDHCSPLTDAGRTLNSVTGLYHERNRNGSPALGSVLRQEPKSRLSPGVAHREINQDPAGYPGAAAHCRAVGTGFRGADAEHNCGEHSSSPFNINGANTYQFVMSNPVGNVDPEGLATVMVDPVTGASFNLSSSPGQGNCTDPIATAVGYLWNKFNEFSNRLDPYLSNPAVQEALSVATPAGAEGDAAKIGEDLMQAGKDAKPEPEPKPDTKGPARDPYPKAGEVKSPADLPEYKNWPSRPATNGRGTVYTDPDNPGRQVREIEPVLHEGADATKRSPSGYIRCSDGYGGKTPPIPM
jgi:hypothetical protein